MSSIQIAPDPCVDGTLTLIRRVVSCAMVTLDHTPVWTSPIGRIATYGALQRCVTLMVETGEVDEAVMLGRAIALVSQPARGECGPTLAAYFARDRT